MEDLLAGLNEEQKLAVTETEGYVRVVAGAGAGKTRALTHRFAYLVNDLGIMPGNILCVTFTNKAATEMRQRIHNLIGDNDTGLINTYHGICGTVLREDSNQVQYPKSFLVLDNADIDAMLEIIYEERGLTLRDMTYTSARDMIEMRKTVSQTDYYLDMIKMSPEDLRQKYLQAADAKDIIFYGYLYQEKKCFGLDYNDLIMFTMYIFDSSPEVRLKWQQRLEYIMVDEFQDIDPLQYKLMEVLAGYHKNLFIVGDPDQTIYTWRGASSRFLIDFDKNHPGTKTILMTKNYRSTPQIIRAANTLIAKNTERIDKYLISMQEDGPKVRACHTEDTSLEAKWIVKQIRQLTGQGVRPRDITILYRAHYVTRPLEEVLIEEKIPYTIYSGVQFFGRMEIKDALCYLRMIAYKDDLSFLRICNAPKRNLGKRRIRFLQQTAEKQGWTLYESLKNTLDDPIFKGTKAGDFIDLIESYSKTYSGRPVSEVLESILDDSGYEKMLRTEGSQDRLDNLAELKQSVYEFETTGGEESTLESYLSHVAMFTNSDMAEPGDKVRLMTIHTAKGLEFPYVFLCAMNEGVFPSRKTDTRERMEEERRLAFVALTRAEKGLYLSEASGRNFDGSNRYPSRFMLDIDPDALEWDQKPEDKLIQEAQHYIDSSSRWMISGSDLPQFQKGDRVRHPSFGRGTVVDLDQGRKAVIIKFDKLPTPRAISIRAKIEKE